MYSLCGHHQECLKFSWSAAELLCRTRNQELPPQMQPNQNEAWGRLVEGCPHSGTSFPGMSQDANTEESQIAVDVPPAEGRVPSQG